MGKFEQWQALCPIFSSDGHNRAFINLDAVLLYAGRKHSSKSNLSQQDSTLDVFTWHLQNCLVECYLMLSLSNLTPYYCFPGLLSSFLQSTNCITIHFSLHMTILFEHMHPSCMKSSAGSLSITSAALSAWASAPLQFLSHVWLFNCSATCSTTPAVGFLPTSPSATSDTAWKALVPKQWIFVLSSSHRKEKLLPKLHQLTGKEQGKFLKLTLNTSL